MLLLYSKETVSPAAMATNPCLAEMEPLLTALPPMRKTWPPSEAVMEPLFCTGPPGVLFSFLKVRVVTVPYFVLYPWLK